MLGGHVTALNGQCLHSNNQVTKMSDVIGRITIVTRVFTKHLYFKLHMLTMINKLLHHC